MVGINQYYHQVVFHKTRVVFICGKIGTNHKKIRVISPRRLFIYIYQYIYLCHSRLLCSYSIFEKDSWIFHTKHNTRDDHPIYVEDIIFPCLVATGVKKTCCVTINYWNTNKYLTWSKHGICTILICGIAMGKPT